MAANTTALTVTQKNRNILATTLEQEKNYVVTVIQPEKLDEFKANYLELANNAYLMDQIPPKEILVTAVNATALGVNVNPIYKEAYILPFNVKGRGMVASIVLPKHGNVQIAFQSGFFLQIDNIWSINGSTKIESEMSFDEIALIKTTNINFVKEHLIGWKFTLTDISDEKIKVPTQTKFVGLEYALSATKQLQMEEFAIQTWVHKATRRAMDEMFIPRHRKSLMLEKIEAWNTQNEKTISIEAKEPIDPFSNNTDTEVIHEAVFEDVKHTNEEIRALYNKATPEQKAKMAEVFGRHPKDWREKQEEINSIYKELTKI